MLILLQFFIIIFFLVRSSGGVTLTCSVAGSPTPAVGWFKDGVQIAGTQVQFTDCLYTGAIYRLQVHKYSLQIAGTQVQFTDCYTSTIYILLMHKYNLQIAGQLVISTTDILLLQLHNNILLVQRYNLHYNLHYADTIV